MNPKFLSYLINRRRLVVIACSFLGVAFPTMVFGATPRAKNSDAALVTKALESEAAGTVSQRSEVLADVTKHNAELQEAHWHSGYVRWNNQWMRFDDVVRDAPFQKKMDSYSTQRSASEPTVSSQYHLAKWCRTNDLESQARVHLTRVLELEPDHEGARSMLGWQQMGGRWVTKFEMGAAPAELELRRKANGTWEPQIKRLFSLLNSTDSRKRDDAEKKLLQIQSPEAIDALEMFCLQSSEANQLLVVEILDKMKSPKASQLLAKLALTDPLGLPGKASCKSLRNRPKEHYVPGLLACLSCPITTQMSLFQNSNGWLVLQQVYVREMESRKENHIATQVFAGKQNSAPNLFGADQVVKEAGDSSSRVEHQNALLQLQNKNVLSVLKTTTGEDLGGDPASWWQWWYDLNSVGLVGEKDTYTTHSTTRYEFVAPKVPRLTRVWSCFVAGTPVWTTRGQVAVEKIEAGDLVLSQDIESGELTYKPVLMPTVRPPVSIVTLKTNKGTIRCSPGHPFWVSGTGWVLAKQLGAGMRLHDVYGTSEIQEIINDSQNEIVYNMIVADFHTYFVGDGKVLVHDNTMREPTSATVPGLVAK